MPQPGSTLGAYPFGRTCVGQFGEQLVDPLFAPRHSLALGRKRLAQCRDRRTEPLHVHPVVRPVGAVQAVRLPRHLCIVRALHDRCTRVNIGACGNQHPRLAADRVRRTTLPTAPASVHTCGARRDAEPFTQLEIGQPLFRHEIPPHVRRTRPARGRTTAGQPGTADVPEQHYGWGKAAPPFYRSSPAPGNLVEIMVQSGEGDLIGLRQALFEHADH